jgi:hypothetical protein
MVLRRVGVLSAGKVFGVMGLIIGLFLGGVMALFAMLGVAIDAQQQGGNQAIPAMFAGVGAVIILPLFYGVFSFISGIIYAALYNLIAHLVGGFELHFERPSSDASLP